VRGPAGEWLATVVISDDGYFSTVSDYGNYAFFWGDAGECFRKFLAQLGPDYYLPKFGAREEYDGKETLKAVKRAIREQRRVHEILREGAREEWDLLDAHSDLDERDNFILWLEETKLPEAYGYAQSSISGEARGFAEHVWPAFAAMLRTELAAESKAA